MNSLVSPVQGTMPSQATGRRRVATAPDPTRPRLLWIDDEISGSDVQVRFLELQGFRVDCALTGSDGLAMARAGGYDGILLDLKLPDLPGLAVLATLRGENITTPVLVLTGFGDFESANVAGRLGAQFKAKPLFIDELTLSIEQTVNGLTPVTAARSYADNHSHARDTASFRSLAALFETLHRLTQRSVDKATWLLGVGTTDRQMLIPALTRALLDPDLPMPVFLACAAALRLVMKADPDESAFSLADQTQISILETLGRPKPRDPHVVAALAMLESADYTRLKGKEIAKLEAVSSGHLSRLVHTETGFGFTEWRSAYLLRASLTVLAETKEHVKQIACRMFRFSDETQFTHEFKVLFGMTPTEFREQCQRNIR
jgi:ActR/RegA family two-component response regulator/AraC-like DNA-binding protein